VKKLIIKILTLVVWFGSGAGMLVLMSFARENYLNSPLKSIGITIDHFDETGFLSEDSIRFEIDQLFQGAIGKSMRYIQTETLLQDISAIPWVRNVKASTDLDGKLKVEIIERKPVIRVFALSGHSVYLDKDGFVFLTNPYKTARVQVVNGHIDFPPLTFGITAHVQDKNYRKTLLSGVLSVGMAIMSDEFANALIDQIYVSSLQEYELTPKLGGVNIMLGDSSDMNEKLDKLKAFYKEKVLSSEMLEYRALNLKFKNQIVCIKKNSLAYESL